MEPIAWRKLEEATADMAKALMTFLIETLRNTSFINGK